MTGWQTTAKTIFCDSVDDEVTLLVFKDGSTRCTGCKKYSQPNAVTIRLIKEKSRRLKRPIKCEGDQCLRITGYKEKIMAEESN
jgi:hypothetical protein